MRTQEELQSPEFNDDMSELEVALKARGIPYIIKKHRGAGGGVKELLGYYPTGEWHIIIDEKYSVIRGMASFGNYEIMNISDENDSSKAEFFAEPERFATPEELIKSLPVKG